MVLAVELAVESVEEWGKESAYNCLHDTRQGSKWDNHQGKEAHYSQDG